jgi:hypothetical protein
LNLLANETSAINALEDDSGDADLHARDDSDSHFEISQELRPSLAFMQNSGARPKFADKTVIEVLPDDSNPSIMTFFIETSLKLNFIAEEPTDLCRDARIKTAVTTWA